MPPRFRSPPGTRDFYPADLLRRRYIEKLWRDTAIRHGFEEIDGPTFEHADLYAVKSGEGILNELFQVFSGKDAGELEAIRAGKSAPYALRPEFTPTLARMYAAKAASLPKPCKWFWQQNCYRAERQQRGRLREFMQWNCDVLGGDSDEIGAARADASMLALMGDLLHSCGLSERDTTIQVNDRRALVRVFAEYGIPPGNFEAAMGALDLVGKASREEFLSASRAVGVAEADLERWLFLVTLQSRADSFVHGPAGGPLEPSFFGMQELLPLHAESRALDALRWMTYTPSLARGLAYYTGMVFEVVASGERAIAGGGRYDNLIELFGGPPTPAVGFGMGDVVLENILHDRKLLPDDSAAKDALSRPSASYRPDAFVISAGQTPKDQDDASREVRPLVARLRRGDESPEWAARAERKPWDADRFLVPPLHARTSTKTTRNLGKLLKDAADQGARFAVVIESGEEATVRDLSRQEQRRVGLADVGSAIRG